MSNILKLKGAIITWLLVIIIIAVLAVVAWWYFNQTNSVTFQPSGTTSQSTSTTITQSSDKSIISFVFSGLTPEVDGVIDNTNYTVSFTVPSGTDVTSLTPTISVSDGATISPISGAEQDFTNPVIYTVTAQDGSTQNYTVTVMTAAAQ